MDSGSTGEAQAGWWFPAYVVLALVLVASAVAYASVSGLRAAAPLDGSLPPGPTRPLTIAGLSVVEAGLATSEVHVAASAGSAYAAFAPSSAWHPEPRQCLADLGGVVGSGAGVEWPAGSVGHITAMAGDSSSRDLYAVVLGEFCSPSALRSADGGATWTESPPPPGVGSQPDWISFDPGRPGTLLAAGNGSLAVSTDGGATWTGGRLAVRPLGLDQAGSLYGWAPGSILTSPDLGLSWDRAGDGPADEPIGAAAIDGGLVLALSGGLWLYSFDGPPRLVRSGRILALAPAGDGAVVIGADTAGAPWLGTFATEGGSGPTVRETALPAGLAAEPVDSAAVAAGGSKAVVALEGPTAAILLVTFAA